MPETTRDEAFAGLVGLTVVRARLKDMTPARAMSAPTSATPVAIHPRWGIVNVNAGAQRVASHMKRAATAPKAAGGILSSRICTTAKLLRGRDFFGKQSRTFEQPGQKNCGGDVVGQAE